MAQSMLGPCHTWPRGQKEASDPQSRSEDRGNARNLTRQAANHAGSRGGPLEKAGSLGREGHAAVTDRRLRLLPQHAEGREPC